MSEDPAVSVALGGASTRRTIVKTGVTLFYAAPLVAVSMKLSQGGAAAIISGGGGCPFPGQHLGADGSCTCAATPCVTNADCCNDFTNGAFRCEAGQCSACTPYTGTVDFDDPDPLPCCDGALFSTVNPFVDICLRACQSDGDCLGVHTCQANGYCGCPAGSLPGIVGASCVAA